MSIVKQRKFGNTVMAVPRGCNPLQRASLYVGDLHQEVTEYDLIRKFSSTVPVVSVRLCRCFATGKSLCYGYVNFYSYFMASTALACLNHTELKGKPMRIMWSHRDPSQRKSGFGNLFVKNIDPSISSACLERIFSPFGTILSCKVAEEDGKSKGFGFVQFDSEESAIAARTALDGSVIDGKKLYVAKFIKKMQRIDATGRPDFTDLYVKNLDEGVDEGVLVNMFSQCGKVSSVVIMRDETRKSKGFGFVNFCQPEDARKAAEVLNGAKLGSKTIFVRRAQKKAERRKMIEHEYKEKFRSKFGKLRDSNLYVKNLGSMDDRRLQELFGRYGKIISTKVMRHENGQSKGFGFVCFSNRDDSEKARKELNGAFVEGRSLFVRVAEQKEERFRKLQGFFAKSSGAFQFNLPPLRPFPPFHLLHHTFPFMPHLFLQGQPSAPAGVQSFLPQYLYQRCTGYSQLPVEQTKPRRAGNTGKNGNLTYQYMPTVYINSPGKTTNLKSAKTENKKPGSENKGNICTLAETRSKGTTSTTLEEATSALKALLKSPYLVEVKDEKAARMMNEEDSVVAPDVAVPKSARCLGF